MTEPAWHPRHVRGVVVREATADDIDGVSALYDRLSSDDLGRRFFTNHRPPVAWLERWMDADARGGAMLVAVDDRGRVIAEAGYQPLPDGDAELGITVDPACRGWLGPWLLDALVEHAALAGVPNLAADVLIDNRRMRAIIAHRGYAVVAHPDWNVVRVTIGAASPPHWPPETPRPRLVVAGGGDHWPGERAAHDADVSVVTCPGPAGTGAVCPVLEGQPCPLVEGADAVVLAFPPDDPRTQRLTEGIDRLHPGVEVTLAPMGADRHPCEVAAAVVDQIHRRYEEERSGPPGSDPPS